MGAAHCAACFVEKVLEEISTTNLMVFLRTNVGTAHCSYPPMHQLFVIYRLISAHHIAPLDCVPIAEFGASLVFDDV